MQFPFTGGSASGTPSFKRLESSSQDYTGFFKPIIGAAHASSMSSTGMKVCSSTEYFLVQYRTPDSYDRGLTAVNDIYGNENSGVVIYHIDESRSDNNTAGEMMVTVETANNLGPELTAANYLQLWGIATAPDFDQYSAPDSGNNAGDGSGVSVSVGSPLIPSGRDQSKAVGITIDSVCD